MGSRLWPALTLVLIALCPLALAGRADTLAAPAAAAATIAAPTAVAAAPSAAYGISRSGEVVGWWQHPYSLQPVAFRWTAQQSLEVLGQGVAYRVNSHQLAVGSSGWMTAVPGVRMWAATGPPTALGPGEALDVNDRAQVVGWTLLPTMLTQAFIWTRAAGLQRLGTLVGTDEYYAGESEARGINDDGLVAGWSIASSGHVHAVRWSAADGFVDLTPESATHSAANAINNLSVAVGVVGSAHGEALAVQWAADRTETVIDPVWGVEAWPSAINDLGQVVGHFLGGGERHAFFWDAVTGWVDLGVGAAHDLNETGTIAGRAGEGESARAVIWQLPPDIQLAAFSRTVRSMTQNAPELSRARAHVHQAERLVAAGDPVRAAERLDRVPDDLARAARKAPSLLALSRSLTIAAQGIARSLRS